MRCMRSAEYAIARGRIANETKQALVFGEGTHLALKFRYKFFRNQPMTEENQIRQFIVLEKFFETRPVPIGDHRTCAFAQSLMEEYNNFYGLEPFDIMKTPDGVDIVEEGFAVPLGVIGNIKIVWKGRLDLCVKDPDHAIWVMDNKTTSIGGDYFMHEYFTSNQMKGYTWACRKILGQAVKGARINALIARKPTKTGKGIEFKRGNFAFDEEVLEEWVLNTLHLVGDFLHSLERGYFTMQTTQCIGRYGLCQFLDTCRLSPETRLQELSSESYKSDVFDPLHDDAIDLEAIANAPIPSNYQRMDASPQSPEPMNAVMAELLGI